jgi:hypothetical protein
MDLATGMSGVLLALQAAIDGHVRLPYSIVPSGQRAIQVTKPGALSEVSTEYAGPAGV